MNITKNIDKFHKKFKKPELNDSDEDIIHMPIESDDDNIKIHPDFNFLYKDESLTKNDNLFGSKSTHSGSKRTHSKPILDNNFLFNETPTIIIENTNKPQLSSKTKSILDNLLKNKEESVINFKNKLDFNKDRFSLLKSNGKTKDKDEDDRIDISDKTKSILANLKNKSGYKLENDEESEFDQYKQDLIFNSLSYKYQELISTPRQLPLPIKYKILYETYISLERFISLSKINKKNHSNIFTLFRKYIKETKNLDISIYNIKQILYVSPHFFIIKPINFDELKHLNLKKEDLLYENQDLLMDVPNNYSELINKNFPNDYNFLSLFYYTENSTNYNPLEQPLDTKDLELRNNIFINSLTNIVFKWHQSFLEKEQIICPFDPIEEKTWHHLFNVNKECKEIPIIEFPDPDLDEEEGEDDFEINEKNLSKNNSIFRNAVESSLINPKSKQFESRNRSNKYVSKNFLNKFNRIKELEKISEKVKILENNNKNKNDISQFYCLMLTQIKLILLTNNNSIPLNIFAETLLNSHSLIKNTLPSVEQLIGILVELSKLFPQLFSIKYNHLIGKVVLINDKNFSIPDTSQIKNILFRNDYKS